MTPRDRRRRRSGGRGCTPWTAALLHHSAHGAAVGQAELPQVKAELPQVKAELPQVKVDKR